jgi:Tfp pilus assembly protein PilW
MMRAARNQDGFSLPELLVTMMSGIVIFTAIVMMTTTALRNQDRISRRVDASSRVRPVLTRMVQELHSACVAQHVAPIIANGTATGQNASTGTQLSFITKSGSSVTPIPEQHVITLAGGTLTESVYSPPLSGSQPGPWTFPATAASTTQLLTNVSAPATGMFQYYDFVNGALDTTPSTVPLSAADAARTAIVKITLTSSPTRGVSNFDPGSPLVVSNSVDLRLENAGQYPNQENLPCV